MMWGLHPMAQNLLTGRVGQHSHFQGHSKMSTETRTIHEDPRYLEPEHPHGILQAWGQDDYGDFTIDLGRWADADEETFCARVEEEIRHAGMREDTGYIIVPVLPEPDCDEDSIWEVEETEYRATAWRMATIRGKPTEYQIVQTTYLFRYGGPDKWGLPYIVLRHCDDQKESDETRP